MKDKVNEKEEVEEGKHMTIVWVVEWKDGRFSNFEQYSLTRVMVSLRN